MPKKGKKDKVQRPAWMSEELWALSQNADELVQNVRGQSALNKVCEMPRAGGGRGPGGA